MKAVRITELDEIKDFPVGYILKATEFKEMVGCCPKAFLNFFRRSFTFTPPFG